MIFKEWLHTSRGRHNEVEDDLTMPHAVPVRPMCTGYGIRLVGMTAEPRDRFGSEANPFIG
jgi:hypothetical protein